jgi:hypothetical protein
MPAAIVLLHAVIASEDREPPPSMCFHGVFAPCAITNGWTMLLELTSDPLVGQLASDLQKEKERG